MTKEKNITHSFYESAPDMLLDCIADVNALLTKVKAKSGENESYKFWKKVSDVMKFTWDYCMNVKWILDRNKLLEQENIWLKNWAAELSNKLEKYETIRQERIQGTLEETIIKVDEYLKSIETHG